MITHIQLVSGRNLYELTFDLGDFEQTGRQMIVTGDFSCWSIEPPRNRNGFIAAHCPQRTFTLQLPSGRYEYKYYDLIRREWMEVERYPEIYRGYHWDYWRNPFGTMNCVIQVPHNV